MDRRLRRRAYAAFYVMLCGGALRLGDRKGSLAWGMRAIARDPRVVARLVGAFSRRSRDGRLLTRSGITSATVHEVVENQLAALDGAALA